MAVIDSYSESNYSADFTFSDDGDLSGQSFTGNGSNLGSVQFYLKNNASAVGNIRAEIYAHSGTFGTNGVPTGSPLAVSDNVAASSIGSTYELVSFQFTGANQIQLVNGTKYFAVYTSDDVMNFPNILFVGFDNTSPSHAGNRAFNTTGSWSSQSSVDVIFYVNDNVQVETASVSPIILNLSIQSATATAENIASVSPITTTLSIPTVTPTYVSNISWYNPSWDYRVKVTVQASQVDADLNNFPIYVDLSDLPAGFHTNVNQTDARDIRVTKADGTTEVPREVVSYDSSTDTGEIHFKGDVSSSTNTDFYIYYGNSGASDYATNATYGAENVWDSNYKAVLHCSQDPSGSAPQIIDSTSNNNDFTSYGTMTTSDLVTGKVGSGIDLDGSDDYLMISDNAGLSGITNLTVQSWVKATTWSTHSFTPIVVKGIGAAGNREWGLYGNNSSQAGQFVARESTTTVSNIFGGSLTTSFHQLTGTYDGSTLRIYVDGAQANSLSTSLVVDDRSANVKIGFSESATFRFSGIVDEVRISNTTRSAGWISTEYNNQSSPSTFFSISAQEEAADNTATVSPVATTLSIPTITPVWVFQTTASVSPVSFTLSVVDPTATYVYEQTTSVSPLATTISLPEVVATYIAVLNADISSIELSLVLPTVSATYKEYIADVSPISTSFSIPDVSAIAIFTASTSPILTTFFINSVTAIFYKPWNTSSVSSNNWTDGIINSNNWEKIDEEISNAWSINNSTSSNWTEPDPG